VHYGPAGPDAVIAFTGGNWEKLGAALREQRHFGFKAVRTRIPGHARHALQRGPARGPLWGEGGRGYWMGRAPPQTTPARELRLAAANLQPLGGPSAGQADLAADPDGTTGATAILTGKTITLDASWGGHCTDAGGNPNNYYGGGVHATLVPLHGNGFSVDT